MSEKAQCCSLLCAQGYPCLFYDLQLTVAYVRKLKIDIAV